MSTWKPPLIHTTYHELKMLSQIKIGVGGGPSPSQAAEVHRKWKSLGKKISQGR